MKIYEVLNVVAFLAFILFGFGLAEILSFNESDWLTVVSCGVVAGVCRFLAKETKKD